LGTDPGRFAGSGYSVHLYLEIGGERREGFGMQLFAGLGFLLVFALFIRPAAGQWQDPANAVRGPDSAQVASAQEPDEPEANPGRPTVSTPATLTPAGYLQFESGFTGANHSPEFSRRYSFNEVVKLSLLPRLELLASVEPTVRATAEGTTGNSQGEVFLGAQGVLYRGEGTKPTLAVSYFHRAYDGGAPEFDYGSPVNSLLVLASADVRRFHYDANAFFTEMERGPVRRAQYGQSMTISHPLFKKLSLSGEIWHFTQPFLRGNAVGNLWAASYAARKTLVFDVGFNRGLTGTSTRWEVFAGFTYLLPHRLW
jgi:hypothetical protein